VSRQFEIVNAFPRSGIRERDSVVDFLASRLLDRSDVICGEDVVAQSVRSGWIALTPPLDLGLVAIQLGVEHRMRAEPIGAEPMKNGPPLIADVVGGVSWRRGKRGRPSVDREGGANATPPSR
jgi:hypothetical protein